MSKYSQISQALYSIEQGRFQRLCNNYLQKNFGGELHSPGSVEDKDKTRPGKPDTYLVQDDGSYILAEITTHDNADKNKFFTKLKNDLTGCLQFGKLGVTANQVKYIVLCCNSTVDISIREELNKMVEPFHISLKVVSIDSLTNYYYNGGRVFARDFLGIPFETGQVLSKEEFLKQYGKKDIATPLDNSLYGRERELEFLVRAFNKSDITVISGPTGVGKSRLAMQAIDNFLLKNKNFQVYYILSKPESIAEDLLTFLLPGNAYIILIDDANRQLGNLLSLLNRIIESDLKVKIILTVRDYAKDDVDRNIPKNNTQSISVGRLSDEIIDEIVVNNPFNIIDRPIRDRIIEISNGNPRLAIMAVNVVKDNLKIDLLKDVSTIYEAYFQSIIHDKSLLNDPLTIKVLGVISFFQTIDTEEKFDLNVLKNFEIAIEDFNKTIHALESMEIVDVYFNSISKISEQVMATYFFYLAFIKTGVLNSEGLFKGYFKTHLWRIRDTFLPTITTFGEDRVIKLQSKNLLNYLTSISASRFDCIQFFEVFGIYFPQKVFVFVDIETKAAEVDGGEFEFNNSYKNTQPVNHDPILRLLELFYEGNNYNFLTALGLAIQYIHKKKSLLESLVNQLKSAFHANEGSLRNNFQKLKGAYQYLVSHLHEDLSYKAIFYYGMHRALLNSSYSDGFYKIKDGEYVFVDSFGQLRSQFFKEIEINYLRDKGICYDLLIEYLDQKGHSNYELKADQPWLLEIIKSHFSAANFEDCYFVQEYINLLNDRLIVILPELQSLTRKFANKDYRVLRVLALDRDKKRKLFHHYKDFYKIEEAKVKYVKEDFSITTLTDFQNVLNSIQVILGFKYRHRYNISYGFSLALENIFKYDVDLGFRALDLYLKNGNIAWLNPIFLFKTIFNLNLADCDRLYDLIQGNEFKYKQEWLQSYFDFLPESCISNDVFEKFALCFNNVSKGYELHLPYFEKYERAKPGTVADLLKILSIKRENDKEFRYKLQYNFFSQQPSLRDSYFNLCKTVYVQQDEIDPSFDHKSNEIFFLMEKDVDFFGEYIDFRLIMYKKHQGAPNRLLTGIWKINEAEAIVHETLIKLYKVDSFNIGIDSFCSILFIHLDEEFHPAACRVLEKLLGEFKEDARMLSIIWNIFRNYLKTFYQEYIKKWLLLNNDIDTFKACDWNNNHFSSFGGQEIWADIKAAELRRIYNAILELPDQYKYIYHHEFLLERISMEERSGDFERKRNYRRLE